MNDTQPTPPPLSERRKNIDIEKFTAEQVDRLSEQIGKQVSSICNEAMDKVNKILNVYGLETKMQLLPPYPIGLPPVLTTDDKIESEGAKPKKRRKAKGSLT